MGTTDKELLELAAKAIGFDLHINEVGASQLWRNGEYIDFWTPLTDDGDALRLAIKLGITITPYPIYAQPKHSVIAKQYHNSGMMRENNPTEVIEKYCNDPMAATRRAIVRCAATLMPNA